MGVRSNMFKPTIIVQGGARTFDVDLKERAKNGVKAAARQGHDVLTSGGSAMDAVVAAVTAMEDDVTFNAGHGSCLTVKGEVEMDAIVVDGKTLATGAVCSLTQCANPVQVARLVMDKTEHCLLAGAGAREFMLSQGMAAVPTSDLVSPRSQGELQKHLQSVAETRSVSSPQSGCDTVGAVAMDANGNLATATSTGGCIAKLPGRVGDSPIIGSGAYADNNVGAVSTTGRGEFIMRVCLARRVGELLEKGHTAHEAGQQALEFMSTRVGGQAGVIVLSKPGPDGACQVGHHFITDHMAWAAISNNQLHWGIERGEENTCTLHE